MTLPFYRYPVDTIPYGMILAMKKKSSSYEPTIKDVLEVVQTGFARHEKILKTLHNGQENIKEQMSDFSKRLINTQNRVEDIADTVDTIARTADTDRARILNLEKASA
jgi:ubiquinone biosynthesis protein UbiJ